MFQSQQDKGYCFLVVVFYAILTIFTTSIPFFWDNVLLVSKIATYYYETNFADFILPNQWDTGHPPFFGVYMAGMWKLFGRSLLVSHWAIYPFMVGMGIAYYYLLKYFVRPTWIPFGMLCLFVEPAILAQSALGGFDIALVCLFLVAANGLVYRKRGLLFIACFLMVGISIRGILMMCLLIACDGVFWLMEKKQDQLTWGEWGRRLLVRPLPYLPAILWITLWYIFHYERTGFTFFNYSAKWAADYGYVGPKRFLWNCCIVAWRILDNGRVILWMTGLFFACKYLKNKMPLHWKQGQLLVLVFVPLICYTPFIVARETPILHRYLMTWFLLVGILIVSHYYLLEKKYLQKLLAGLTIFSLILGHLWVYPIPIANGWDAHLGFLPYLSMQKKIENDLLQLDILKGQVATTFPLANARKYTHLEADTMRFYDEWRDLDSCQLVLFSNLSNDFTPLQIQQLEQHWTLLKHYQQFPVEMKLYQHPSRNK